MHTRDSEFGARRAHRFTLNVLALALVGVLSACATKGPAGSATGTGGASAASGSTSTGASAQGGTGSTAGRDAGSQSARERADVGAGGAVGGNSGDPLDGLVSRNPGSRADHPAGSSVSGTDGSAGAAGAGRGTGATGDGTDVSAVGGGSAPYDPVSEAIKREQASRGSASGDTAGRRSAAYDPVSEAIEREQASRGAASGGTAGAGSAAGDSASAVVKRDQADRPTASGASHKSGGDTLALDEGEGADGDDPVRRALRQAEKQRQAGAGEAGGPGGTGAGGAGDGTGTQGSRSGTGSQAAGAQDSSPVAEALRRAEAAEAAARERERLEAEARRGRVETAANSVLIDQDDRLQTLDGMLPMALSMDEQGLFDFDRYQLRQEVKKSLDELAEKLKTAAYDKLHILGFTDRIGTEEYNRRLSEKRAWAVAGYLMNKGVPPHKLRVVGRGEEGSVVGDDQCEGLTREAMIECLQRDRRVEIAATVKEYQLEVR